MHEYEFRLVVISDQPFTTFLQSLGSPVRQSVFYLKDHIRFRHGQLERKIKKCEQAVFHKGLWFKWVHSIEIPYHQWTKSNHVSFLSNVCNYLDPIQNEVRYMIQLDECAQIYTFQNSTNDSYHLVFEWEYGTFEDVQTTLPTNDLIQKLDEYSHVWEYFKSFDAPPYTLNEVMTRKPVTCVNQHTNNPHSLVAHKLNGIFGLVISFPDHIKEKWENYTFRTRKNKTLGDGLVFAAEKINRHVVLLDVYQVRGCETASWSRRSILTEFLPSLSLPSRYSIQHYADDYQTLRPSPFPVDGYIQHDVMTDKILKIKQVHSLDVIYEKGYFWLPKRNSKGLCRRFKCKEPHPLRDGHVYEVSIDTGRVLRIRKDRFTGNTWQQIENILKPPRKWKGPPIQDVIKEERRKTRS